MVVFVNDECRKMAMELRVIEDLDRKPMEP